MSRFKYRPYLLVGLCLLVFASVSFSQEAPPKIDDTSMVIEFTKATKTSDVEKFVENNEFEIVYQFGLINAIWVKTPGKSAKNQKALLENNPQIEAITLDCWGKVSNIPNDPRFDEQWSLENYGETNQYLDVHPHVDIDAKNAWNLSTGDSTIIVAIVDTGIDYNHPDLVDNIYHNYADPINGIDDDGNGFIDDHRGWDFKYHDNDPFPTPNMSHNFHGTHVGGIVGATGNNAVGVSGVCQNVKLLPLKIGDGVYVNGTAGMAALDYAVSKIGVDVVNNSWYGLSGSSTYHNLFLAASAAGVFTVNCAGNTLQNPSNNNDIHHIYPSDFVTDLNLGIANSTFRDELDNSSNFGPLTLQLAAPGKYIMSTVGPLNEYNPPYDYATGTSMSSPMVAGAIALIKSYITNETPLQIRDRLLDHAEIVPELVTAVQLGRRLNVYRAMTDPDYVAPSDIIDLTITDFSKDSATFTWTAPGDDGSTGTARYYDLRYSESVITEANFGDSEFIYECTVPVASGGQQSFVLEGLNPSTTYYFAVKAADDWRNLNGLSNVVSATTLGLPQASFTPASALIPAAVVTGTLNNATFAINNQGTGDLTYSIAITSGSDVYSVSPSSGTIEGNSSGTIQVAIDCSGICNPGQAATLTITTNDPNHLSNNYYIYQQVTDGPEISSSVSVVDFGDVPLFAMADEKLNLLNIGCSTLTISSTSTGTTAFTYYYPKKAASNLIAAGGSKNMTVYFAPPSPGNYSDVVTIVSDDPNNSPYTIILTGRGVLNKSADPSPSFSLDLCSVPNPFNPQTEFQFNLPKEGNVEINIFNIRGEKIRILKAGAMNTGPNNVLWNGSNSHGTRTSSGIYFYQLMLDGAQLGDTGRTVMLK